MALPVHVREPARFDAVTAHGEAAVAEAVVERRPHPGQHRHSQYQGRDEEGEPFAAAVEQCPECRHRNHGPESVHVKRRHDARDDAGEKERPPLAPLAHRQPEDQKDDQREAEAEQRRSLRHQVGEHRVQPLKVEAAIERVLARKMPKNSDPAVEDVADQVEETEATAEQKNEDRNRGGCAAAHEAQGSQVHHGWEGKAEQSRCEDKRAGQRGPAADPGMRRATGRPPIRRPHARRRGPDRRSWPAASRDPA